MYWGGWVIWKDVNKNGGYPVSFYDSATKVSMVFKFKGGKYAGQPSNNIIIEPKSITVPFNLGQFGKLSNKVMSATITKYQKSNPKEEGYLTSLKNKISNNKNLKSNLKRILSGNKPMICELMLDHNQEQMPKAINKRTSDGKSLATKYEDMYPFLSPKEINENMLYKTK
jgi:hypothetical protein